MRCLSCRYDLSGLTEYRCPECGRTFDPLDATSFSSRNSGLSEGSQVALFVIGVLLLVALFTVAVIAYTIWQSTIY